MNQTVTERENLCEGREEERAPDRVPGSAWLGDLHEFISTINSYLQRVVKEGRKESDMTGQLNN